MNNKPILATFLILLSIVLFLCFLPFFSASRNITYQAIPEIHLWDYIPHTSIEIESDNDLLQFPGSGTSEDPFIIEGLNITTYSDCGIYITSTTKYFIIRNCYINANEQSIYLKNIAKGTGNVENNFCSNSQIGNGVGIEVENSENLIVTNNICTDNDYYGILVSNSNNSTLKNNTCSRNRVGIIVFSSENSLLYNNTCVENENVGIEIMWSTSSIVERNICSKNNEFGMVLWDSNETLVIENTISESKEDGIFLSNNNDTIFSFNTLKKNGYYGMFLDHRCYFNEIYYNNFIENNYHSQNSQGCDNGVSNSWSNLETKKGNFWSDKSIFLESYWIDGSADSIDYYPLKKQIEREDEKTDFANFYFSLISNILIVLVLIFVRKTRKFNFLPSF